MVILRLLAFCLLPSAVLAQTNGSERSVAGSFTEDQVKRGDVAFQSYCLSCHTPTFHTGEQFRMNWLGRTVYDYFKLVKKTMPEDNPGGLTDAEYTLVLAYIFRMNGFPTGTDSLSTDTLAMKSIRISAPPADSVKPTHR